MKKKKETDINAQLIQTLRNGLEQPFWAEFKRLLVEEKENAEMAVFEDDELSEKQRNDLRLRRNVLQYVIELPGLVIEKSLPRPRQTEPDFETYE